MQQFLASLATLGRALTDINDLAFSTIHEYYTCEITDSDFSLVYVAKGGQPLKVTKRVLAGSGSKCDTFDANLKFLFNLRGFDENPFWIKCTESLAQAKATAVLQAVKHFRESLNSYIPQCAEKKGIEGFYKIQPKGSRSKPKLAQVPTRKNMESLGVISDGIPIVLTYKGTPLLDIPAIKKWWVSTYAEAGEAKAFDLITGQPCQPIPTMDRIDAIDSPLISFNDKSYSFEGFKQMLNYPMSKTTQDQISAGFKHIAKYEQAQCLTLDDTNISTLKVGWWPEGCVEHPLLPLMGILVRGGKGSTKAEVDQAWKDLRDLELDATPAIRFAAWQHAKSRFALLETWVVKARDLRKNLLLWHEEWGACGYDPVGPILTHVDKPLPTFLPKPVFLPTFKAVTTGSAYSELIPKYFVYNRKRWESDDPSPTQVWSNRYGSIWFFSYFSRKYGNFMGKRIAERKQYDRNDKAQSIDVFTKASQAVLQDPALAAYNYGVLLALNSRIMALYKYHQENRRVSAGDVLRTCRNPAVYYKDRAAKFAVYREWLRTNCASTAFGNIDVSLDKVEAGVSAATLVQPLSNMAMYTNLGWNHGIAYINELKNYTAQMATFDKTGEKPKDPPNTVDEEEIDADL